MIFIIVLSSFLDLFFSFLAFNFLSFDASYILKRFNLNAFDTTQKLDKLMAAAPNIGFNFHLNSGYHTPAASGIPIIL